MTTPDARTPPVPDLTVLTWPRHTGRLLLRPVTMDDVEVAATYRGDPEVTRYLRHECLTREQVLQRHRDRTAEPFGRRREQGNTVIRTGR